MIKPSFEANGKTYHILGEKAITFKRLEAFEKMRVAAGFGRSFDSLVRNLRDIQLRASKPLVLSKGESVEYAYARRSVEITVSIESVLKAIMELSEERFTLISYACTIFVVLEDEDLTDWNEELAESKLEDWNKEQLSPVDFFLLFSNMLDSFSGAFEFLQTESTGSNQKEKNMMPSFAVVGE